MNILRKKTIEQSIAETEGKHQLKKVLGPWALISFGIGCIIGTGIFVLTGIAAHDKAGPALILSFVLAGVVTIISALCYAEFASMVPVAGSTYSYSYITLGELFAWIIGWDLILEYTVAAAAVAHGWSHYLQNLLALFKINFPSFLSKAPFDLDINTGQMIFTGSYFDLLSVLIITTLSIILIRGMKESSKLNNIMVIVKLAIILLVIFVGAFYIDFNNYFPFAPFGYGGISIFGKTIWGSVDGAGQPVGVIAGAAIAFFAYIGFDAVSTSAEETKNPARDLPFGIIGSLLISTILYIAVTAVLTGMVKYNQIDLDAPIAKAFEAHGLHGIQFIIDIGALTGITSVILVLLIGQTRIFFAMSRDGLLPKKLFSEVHPKFKTPYKSTILTGLIVSILAGFLPLRILSELVNIGTLLAFVIISVAIIVLRYKLPNIHRPFKVPFGITLPILGVLFNLILMFSLPVDNWLRLFVWLAIGLIIYFLYGRNHSILNKQ
jgi:APA family basic amino acid/polyamine antiporter